MQAFAYSFIYGIVSFSVGQCCHKQPGFGLKFYRLGCENPGGTCAPPPQKKLSLSENFLLVEKFSSKNATFESMNPPF